MGFPLHTKAGNPGFLVFRNPGFLGFHLRFIEKSSSSGFPKRPELAFGKWPILHISLLIERKIDWISTENGCHCVSIFGGNLTDSFLTALDGRLAAARISASYGRKSGIFGRKSH